ncbi:MAG: hypothetical protein ACI3ZP_08265 [Candidatus Cryptobacteroides sp.]
MVPPFDIAPSTINALIVDGATLETAPSTKKAQNVEGALREDSWSAEDGAMRSGMMGLKARHDAMCNKMPFTNCG